MQSALLGRAAFLCWEMQDGGRAEMPTSLVIAVLWGQEEEDGPSPDLLQKSCRPSPEILQTSYRSPPDLLQSSPWADGS